MPDASQFRHVDTLLSKEIRSIVMRRVGDSDPDLSYLGSYSNQAGPYSIDRRGPEPGDEASCKTCYWTIRYDEPGGWHHITQESEPYTETEEAEAGHDAEPDREYRGHGLESGSYVYFNPVWQNYADGKGNLADEKEDMRYMRQDFERMESYHRGEWGMVGVYARASITVAGIIQTVQSGGLWGIESDSDESYFAEIEAEQLSELVTVLEELGFERTAIDEACEDVTDASD